ncbi:MAG: ATP-binding protein [Nitrospirae bacterium]|uniref:AAA family ATPase n=1 Tax=Candidatus Magnetobacterium casense TaxID=1455061 RepID=UPI00058D81E1|nr:AAA family ATPase [Candidatus Magnetobacterium casensis]MBF0338046.1 ATP-binding protein [Nitrospirota bacterium]
MILKSIEYCENKDTPHYWEIQGVEFGQLNLIVGINATGKTLLLNAISRLAKFMSPNLKSYQSIIQDPIIADGHWKIEFYDKTENIVVTYELEIARFDIKAENITADEKAVLNRINDTVKVYTKEGMLFDEYRGGLGSSLSILHSYPIPAKLLYWARTCRLYPFDDRNQFEVYSEGKKENEDAPIIISTLMGLLKNNGTKEKLMEDFNYIGYPVDDIYIEPLKHQHISIIEAYVKEKGLLFPTAFYRMSQGMFRAFTSIAIIEDLLLNNSECTLVIDDIGEGLDFDRSSKLIKLIFNKLKGSNIQFIAATNNRFLINAVDIRDLNILERDGHVVKSYNYSNSKEQFDEFEFTGLGSFDLFRFQMYKTQEV